MQNEDAYIPSDDFLAQSSERRRDSRANTKRRKSTKKGRPWNFPGMANLPELSTHERYAYSRKQTRRSKAKYQIEHVAVLDFETDPFDNTCSDLVLPFMACLYLGPNETPQVFWDEDFKSLVSQIVDAINALPAPYTIYAHNGGRFDYMYLFSEISGECIFKGRSLMHAKIGEHRLRDSFHIIPEKLAAIRKEVFDYAKLTKKRRKKHRDEIVEYCISDCAYTYEVILDFIRKYGFKLSIGQAAIEQLKLSGHKYDKLTEIDDAYMRDFFFGGRVECLRGRGHWRGEFKLYDVNSMYPSVMAEFEHPISQEYSVSTNGVISPDCHFIELTCKSNGAFLDRSEDGSGLTSYWPNPHRFCVTRFEYDTAMRHNLLSGIEVHRTVTFERSTNFSDFVLPRYSERRSINDKLDAWTGEHNAEYWALKREQLFLKLLLNNAYGKFAQNPRRFKEVYLTKREHTIDKHGAIIYPKRKRGEVSNAYIYNGLYGFEYPSADEMREYRETGNKTFWGVPNSDDDDCRDFSPDEDCGTFLIWERANADIKGMFNNVATGASITGAARARLLDAICRAKNPLYCDTDSIICEELTGVELHPTKLGAWKCEAEIEEVLIGGKKLYGYRVKNSDKLKIKSKGARDLLWDQLTSVVYGDTVKNINPAPTILKDGTQFYIERTISATSNIVDFSARNLLNGVTSPPIQPADQYRAVA